jgi:hypothetical protein
MKSKRQQREDREAVIEVLIAALAGLLTLLVGLALLYWLGLLPRELKL